MATDNTPPRLRLIVTIAVIVIITLVGLDFVFKSYYAFMSDIAVHEKLAPPKDLTDQHAVELASFAAARVPVDRAMAELAKGSRAELIEPKPSDDLAPMTGWSKLPKPAPVPLPGADHADQTVAADSGAPEVDAGGAPHALVAPPAPEAGAPHDAGAVAPHGGPNAPHH